MSFNYKSIDSIASASAVNQKAKESLKKQTELNQQMLCTMLKNQVPGNETNMSDVIQMTISTANASNQMRGNELLEQNIRLNHAIFSTMMGMFEGSVVDHKSNAFYHQGDSQSIRYEYPKDAQEVEIAVVDKSGGIVHIDTLSPDETQWIWNGKRTDGEEVPHGIYRISLKAINKEGEPTEAPFWMRNKVTEILYDNDGKPILMAGRMPIGDLKSYHRNMGPDIPLFNEQV